MVKGTKEDMDELIRILETFNKTSGMKINLKKLCLYWFVKYTHKHDWQLGYKYKWAEKCNIS